MDLLSTEDFLALHKPKMLIVDDQAIIIHALNELFRSDYEIFMATSGKQAIGKVKDIQPDIILLDIVMPDIDGYEVCRQIKAERETGQIPIIFITSQFEESDEIRGFEVGAADFIKKPINPIITRARVSSQVALKLKTDLLECMSMLDGLTNIANRRKFDTQIEQDWALCQRESSDFSILMIDVDHFKLYNDHYGHKKGDECLKSVASALQNSLKRPYDLLARYGGEEFSCILPRTDIVGAIHLANDMLRNIQDLNIENASSPVAPHVTVSIGIAHSKPSVHSSYNRAIELADAMLYEAKAKGRNQYCYVSHDESKKKVIK